MARRLLLLLATLPALAAAREDPVRFRTLAPPPGLRADVRVVVPELGPSPVQRAASRAIRQRCDEVLRDFSRAVRETRELRKKVPDMPDYRFELSIEPTVSLNSSRRVSVLLTVFEFTGGAHPNTRHETYLFAADGQGAKRIRLSDLLRPGQSPQAFAATELLPELNRIKAARDVDPAESIDAQALESFVATPAGITWVFSPHTVGAYAEGTYIVKLSWERLRPYLRDRLPLP